MKKKYNQDRQAQMRNRTAREMLTRRKSLRITISGCEIVILPSTSTWFGTKLFAVISKLSSLEYTVLRMLGMRGVIRGCALLRMAASELSISRKALRYDTRVGRCSSEVFVMCSMIAATTLVLTPKY
jgi:hypothetical protein